MLSVLSTRSILASSSRRRRTISASPMLLRTSSLIRSSFVTTEPIKVVHRRVSAKMGSRGPWSSTTGLDTPFWLVDSMTTEKLHRFKEKSTGGVRLQHRPGAVQRQPRAHLGHLLRRVGHAVVQPPDHQLHL